MKKFLAIFCVITSGMISGMEFQEEKVKVSSPRHLNERFSSQQHLKDFADSTGLINRFAGKELSSAGIKLAITTYVTNYQHEIYKNGGTVYHLHSLEKEVKDIFFSS